jgi:hypothetical protein
MIHLQGRIQGGRGGGGRTPSKIGENMIFHTKYPQKI